MPLVLREKIASLGSTGQCETASSASKIESGKKHSDSNRAGNNRHGSSTRRIVRRTLVTALSHVSGIHPLLFSSSVIGEPFTPAAPSLPVSSPPQCNLEAFCFAATGEGQRRLWARMGGLCVEPPKISNNLVTSLALNSAALTDDQTPFKDLESNQMAHQLLTASDACLATSTAKRHKAPKPHRSHRSQRCCRACHRGHPHCGHSCYCRHSHTSHHSKSCSHHSQHKKSKKESSGDKSPVALNSPFAPFATSFRAGSSGYYDPINDIYNGRGQGYVGESSIYGSAVSVPRSPFFSPQRVLDFKWNPSWTHMDDEALGSFTQSQPYWQPSKMSVSTQNALSDEHTNEHNTSPPTLKPPTAEQEQSPPSTKTSRIPVPPPLPPDLPQVLSRQDEQLNRRIKNWGGQMILRDWLEGNVRYKLISNDNIPQGINYTKLQPVNGGIILNDTEAATLHPSEVIRAFNALKGCPMPNAVIPLTETTSVIKLTTPREPPMDASSNKKTGKE